MEILEKTSQSERHPLDRRKSWKKPHNLSPILALRKVLVDVLPFHAWLQSRCNCDTILAKWLVYDTMC